MQANPPTPPFASRRFGRPPGPEVALFLRQFATLMNAGVSWERSLGCMSGQTKNIPMKACLKSIQTEVEAGKSFHQALENLGDAFDPFIRNSVRVGETAGTLPFTLDRLSDYYERRLKIEAKAKSQLVYPLFVLVLTLLLLAILPGQSCKLLQPIFAETGVQLNLLSASVLKFGLWMDDPRTWLAFLAGGFLVFLGLRSPGRRKKLWLRGSVWLLKAPAIRALVQARFLNALAMLLTVGTNLNVALPQAGRLLSYPQVEQNISKVSVSLSEGTTLAQALEQIPEFDPLVRQFIEVGEESGQLPELLARLGTYYEVEFESRLEIAMQWLEPLVLGFLGLFVGFFIVALALPLSQILGKL